MWLIVNKLTDGPGPGEVLVEVATTTGNTEQVIVHTAALDSNKIEIGHPIHKDDNGSLVELPRESMSGKWRIWVPTASLAEA